MQRTEIIEALQKVRHRLPADLLEFVEACPYGLEKGWIEEGEVFRCVFPLSRAFNAGNYINNLIKVAEFLFKVRTGSRSCLSYPGITMPVKKYYRLFGTDIKEFISTAEGWDAIQNKGTIEYCELEVEVVSKRLSSSEQQRQAVLVMLKLTSQPFASLQLESIFQDAIHGNEVTASLSFFLEDVEKRGKGLEQIDDVFQQEEGEDRDNIPEEMKKFAYDILEQMKVTKTDKKTLIDFYCIKHNKNDAVEYVGMLEEMEKFRRLLLDYNYIKEDLTPCVPLEEIREYLISLKDKGQCQYCGKAFPYRSNKKYCSPNCRRMAHYHSKDNPEHSIREEQELLKGEGREHK